MAFDPVHEQSLRSTKTTYGLQGYEFAGETPLTTLPNLLQTQAFPPVLYLLTFALFLLA